MRAYTFDEMKKLVKDNNKSRIFSDEFVVCLIWKESGFRAAIKNAKTSATGLMQLTIAAVQMVNGCSPQGVHFEHSDMTDAAKNIQCGTYYLDIAKTKLKDALIYSQIWQDQPPFIGDVQDEQANHLRLSEL